MDGDRVRIAWFAEAGRVPRKTLSSEVERLSAIIGTPLQADVAAV
jgi:hypothetical protein